jgi:hypothetical protein
METIEVLPFDRVVASKHRGREDMFFKKHRAKGDPQQAARMGFVVAALLLLQCVDVGAANFEAHWVGFSYQNGNDLFEASGECDAQAHPSCRTLAPIAMNWIAQCQSDPRGQSRETCQKQEHQLMAFPRGFANRLTRMDSRQLRLSLHPIESPGVSYGVTIAISHEEIGFQRVGQRLLKRLAIFSNVLLYENEVTGRRETTSTLRQSIPVHAAITYDAAVDDQKMARTLIAGPVPGGQSLEELWLEVLSKHLSLGKDGATVRVGLAPVKLPENACYPNELRSREARAYIRAALTNSLHAAVGVALLPDADAGDKARLSLAFADRSMDVALPKALYDFTVQVRPFRKQSRTLDGFDYDVYVAALDLGLQSDRQIVPATTFGSIEAQRVVEGIELDDCTEFRKMLGKLLDEIPAQLKSIDQAWLKKSTDDAREAGNALKKMREHVTGGQATKSARY